MTDTKPTLEEQIEWAEVLIGCDSGIAPAVLASLKELQNIKSQPVPVEPDVLVKRLRNEADRLDPPHQHEFNEKGQRLGHPGNVVVLLRKSAEHIDTLHQQLQVAQQERDDVGEIIERMKQEGWHREERMAYQHKLLHDIKELLREAGK